MDENRYIPPDLAGAEKSFCQAAIYTEALWKNEFNKDESKVRSYTLPVIQSETVEQWEKEERPRLVEQFKEILYGDMPPAPDKLETEVLSEKDNALDGLAVRKELRIHCSMNDGRTFYFDMLLYVPKNVTVRPPVFLGLNFSGNQANTPEDDVRTTRAVKFKHIEPYFDPITARGILLDSWNYVEAMKRGYAVATACYGEICPDHLNGLHSSVFTLFYDEKELRSEYEVPFEEQRGGAWRRKVSQIGAWAWGLSRMLDALEQEPLVDAGNAAVIGHSRNGKAAVWAGVCDERFKLVISNNSGCGGASLSRRNFGETLRILFWEKRPWVAGNLVDYIDDPGKLPFDQHMVLGAIAPRYLYVASSSEDAVADPKGEFLAAQAASRVWELYGKTGLGEAEQPPLNVSTGVEVGYHCKEGKHGIRAFDWEQYYNFADKVFRRTR